MSVLAASTAAWNAASIDSVALVEFGTRVTKRLDAGTRYPVYGGGGATFSMDEYNREDCYVVSRFGMSEECVRSVQGRFFLNDSGLTVRSRDPNLLCQRFLDLYLLGSQSRIFELGRGAAQKNLHVDGFRQLQVPLPALDEQRRIVAVLDQAFVALDHARANADMNLRGAKSLFLSALRDVFSNHSSAWPSNALPSATNELGAGKDGRSKRSKDHTQTGGRQATARPIPGEYSLSVLAPKVKPRQGWRWSPLSSLARLESGHTPSRRHPEYWSGGIGWISIRDAKDHNGETILETREQTNELGISKSSARVLPKGTVCLSRTASVGYVVKMGAAMATSQDFVNWICGPDLDPDFLMLLLQAQGADIKKFASGAVHQTIYFPEVKAFHVCHPAVEVQRQISGSLREVRKEAAKAEGIYVRSLADIAALRQSLLHAAFSGQLT